MAHEVTLDISTKFVLHKDVKIEVKTSDGKLGTVLVSKGNIEWLPAKKKRRQQEETYLDEVRRAHGTAGQVRQGQVALRSGEA